MATMPLELTFILAKQGDKEALAVLYVTFKPYLMNYVRSIFRRDNAYVSDDVVEDIVSDVTCVMIENIQKLDTNNVKAFYKWLRTTAYNKTMDYYRERTRTTDLLRAEDLLSSDDDPAKRFEIEERNTIVHKAVDMLSTKKREAVIGKFVHGKSHHALGQKSGKSEDAMCKFILRALQKLKSFVTPLLVPFLVCASLIAALLYGASKATPHEALDRVHQFIFAGSSHGTTPRPAPTDMPLSKPTAAPKPSPSPTSKPTPSPTPKPSPVPTRPAPQQPASQPSEVHGVSPDLALPSSCAIGVCLSH
jgi:RNA polymerase sigma factor (sigma-70 family)